MREIGIMDIINRRWIPRKPPCIGNLGFNSIGITEVKPALTVLVFGFALAFSLMITEIIHKQILKYCTNTKLAAN